MANMTMRRVGAGLGVCLLAVGAVWAAEGRPPIPEVPKEAKTLAPERRPDSDRVVQERIQRFNAQAREGGFDVLFIGDSITHLWEEHGREVWSGRIAPFNAVNFGIGGGTTQTVLWRLDNGNLEGALDPKVVVLMIGTNNHEDCTPEETAAGIGAILERIHTRLPKAVILLHPIFPRQAPDSMPRKVNDAVNAILAKYDGFWNIRCVDVAPRMTDERGHLRPGLCWDGLHLTRAGYEAWADVLVPELEALLNRPPRVAGDGRE
jgi:lysophospholipase L1-like esterase